METDIRRRAATLQRNVVKTDRAAKDARAARDLFIRELYADGAGHSADDIAEALGGEITRQHVWRIATSTDTRPVSTTPKD